ncbi:tRNA U34 5-methylaminomethyl-2-thiouridine-forming methyltransferase MnmC [Pustulibacterium marinum]|uniref:tRNA U34 5-methylaminomethyl-2-thiouridine-forming methyltransferase MnmC n=1 Tax=Pustulibacterium marinum TaxID=1224947 RepID=A0A1I7FD51_9FLAO|nr:tRNA (5-methylaminomethyl-2-thiouridine)(34)-methyltransferase MnmD [Pustulibacterium marinum]SFU34088.1 tRNA U34 5-methylaminomethyl-2-thiouridine-forming methyltransferase MnmC [Pustulibacterium marinum]
MNRKVVKTADGSTTIHIEEWNENYHSSHGAIQEAYHVFIKSGLNLFPNDSTLGILEIGFGTGLNAFITFLEAEKRNLHIKYHGVEAYPVQQEELDVLNYVEQLQAQEKQSYFNVMHAEEWEKEFEIAENFILKKRKQFFSEIEDKNSFNLIYFDAFGARVQPDLWTEEIFQKMYDALETGGVLVTYAAKGSVRRAMLSVGFSVEKLAGPPGKREMLRATKN